MTNKKFGNVRVLKSEKVQARYYLPTGEQVTAGTFDTVEQAQVSITGTARRSVAENRPFARR